LETILTLSELITELSESSKDNYKSIFKNLKLNADELEGFANWSSQSYMRNGIYKDDCFELILICWEEGQETSIHCHGGEECWVYLLDGEVQEVFYGLDESENLITIGARSLHKNQDSYINDSIGFHKLKNNTKGRTMSLHLYAKPIENCTFYDQVSETFVEKKLSYDTFKNVMETQKSNSY